VTSLTGSQLLTLVGLGYTVAYVASIYLHPYNNCRACKGKGLHRGKVFTYSRRNCHVCSGTGTKQRLGAYILGRGRPRQGTSRIPPATREFGRRQR
jgi:hypothetical protein